MNTNKLTISLFILLIFFAEVKAQSKLQSVSVLKFGPENTLFVGDSRAGKIFAFPIDKTHNTSAEVIYNVKDADTKIAALLATTPDKILVKDIAVNPVSREVYIGVDRVSGKTYTPAIVIMNHTGAVRRFDDAKARSSFIKIDNTPSKDFRFFDDVSAIERTFTDIDFHKGKLYISGISNTDFASTLKVVDFPFTGVQKSASIEIYHTTHDQKETRAPIRTMEIVTLGGREYILAAYTCTPLVTIPLDSIRDGAHVSGKTIAELGYGNTPIDFISYAAQGSSPADTFPVVFLANNSQSAQILRLSDIEQGNEKDGLNSFANYQKKGVPAMEVPITGVLQIAEQDDQRLVSARRNVETGRLELVSIRKNLYLRLTDAEGEYAFPDYRSGPNQKMFKELQNMLFKEEGYPNRTVK